MMKYIDIIIGYLCYTGFALGLWFFVSPFILPLIKNQIQIRRTRNELRLSGKRKNKNPIIRHIEMLLFVVFNKRSTNSIIAFFIISFSFLFITFLFLTANSGITMANLLLSIFVGAIPYLALQVRLRSIRIDGSYEAEKLITELLNQYKINYFNMVEAIDQAIPFLNSCRYSKRALLRLSMRIKEYSSKDELEQIIYEFVYSIGTDWAIMLGQNISLSISDGVAVSESLEDILTELHELKKVVEKDKRDNTEAFVMIKFFALGVYAVSVFMAVTAFNIKIGDYIRFQFHTGVGIKFTFTIIVLVLINYGLMILFRKPKYDL